MKLTQSIEDYLEAIYILEHSKQQAKSVTIANMLHVSKPAVTKAMNELMSLGYIIKKPYSDIFLTEKGRKIGKNIYHRHTVLHKFLEDKLGLSHEIAERDCCMIEHVISKETLEAIERLL